MSTLPQDAPAGPPGAAQRPPADDGHQHWGAFPETVGVVLLRGAWRYRSELAPLGVTAGLVAAAWWLHPTRPHWWLPLRCWPAWPRGRWPYSARGGDSRR